MVPDHVLSPHHPPGIGPDPQNRAAVRPASSFPRFCGLLGMRGDLVGVCAHPRSFPLLPRTHLLFLGFLFWPHLAARGPVLPRLRIEPVPPPLEWKLNILATVPPGKSHFWVFSLNSKEFPRRQTRRVEGRRCGCTLCYCTLKILH